jgi:hypothetical protein
MRYINTAVVAGDGLNTRVSFVLHGQRLLICLALVIFSLAGCKGNNDRNRLPATKVRELIAHSGLSIPESSRIIASGEGRKIYWFIVRTAIPITIAATDCVEMKESIFEVLRSRAPEEELGDPIRGIVCEWRTKEATWRTSGLVTSKGYYLLVEFF